MKNLLFLHQNWTFRQKDQGEWLPATVPGVVHTDLLANRRIGDPFFGTNELELQWIEDQDWEYRTVFSLPADWLSRQHVELVFKGLDTYASVYLNDKPVLEANNMFREWRAEVGTLLNTDKNELRVLFRSPIREDLPKKQQLPYELPAGGDQDQKTSPFTRKAPYHFGWDWGPRFVTCGLWQPVYLEAWDTARIRQVQIVARGIQPEKATVKVRVEIEADSAGSAQLWAGTAEGKVTTAREIRLAPGKQTHELTLEIANPRLWFPRGYGEQALYRFVIKLSDGSQLLDETAVRTGLRTLELRREQDEWGESFMFIVNGIPVYAKGANWIPPDSFLPRVTRQRYRELLNSAVEANMNMLRVWGGGIYENDTFYELCDELGILVWQDFMFACAMYPGDPDFLDSVREEARYQIRRLRHHPSIAIWCGNNEIEQGWFDWGWAETLPESVWQDYKRLFYGLLPEVCAEEDPGRPYWPSSPSSLLREEPNSQRMGDTHYWGVWHFNKPFEDYLEQHPRFMTEFGFQSFPEKKTVAAYAPGDQWDINSPVMLLHQKHPRGNQLIHDTMRRYYPEPKDFESFLYLSQVQQAEGIKIGAEHLRRIRPRCMGSLYWQLNDCWPVASWSSIDCFGRWKALHYYARRFYSPVLVSLLLSEAEVRAYAISDLQKRLTARLELTLFALTGERLWRDVRKVEIPAFASQQVWRADVDALLQSTSLKNAFLTAELRSGERSLSKNLLFFRPVKDLQLPVPHIGISVNAGENGATIHLETGVPAFAVQLQTERLEGRFSDNFFFLLPGEPVQVQFLPEGKWDPDQFVRELSLRSLADTFV